MSTTQAPSFVNLLTMEVSKNIQKGGQTVREVVGSVSTFLPGLKDFGIDVEPVSVNEEGVPSYAELTHNWLQTAITQLTKANARNRLKSGTTELKPGAKLPESLLELVTPSENNSTVLAERRGLFDFFKAYLATQDKSDTVKRLLSTFLEKPEMLAIQPEEQRAKIKPYFEAFGAEYDERFTEWQGNYLLGVIEQCDAEPVDF